MKSKKSILYLFIICMLACVLLCGCGDDDAEQSSTPYTYPPLGSGVTPEDDEVIIPGDEDNDGEIVPPSVTAQS